MYIFLISIDYYLRATLVFYPRTPKFTVLPCTKSNSRPCHSPSHLLRPNSLESSLASHSLVFTSNLSSKPVGCTFRINQNQDTSQLHYFCLLWMAH